MSSLMLMTAREFEANRTLMQSVARQLIAERRRDPKGNEKHDLLNLMLNGVDPVTGEKLDDENIINQMITFLIAGHETTSGLLTFATYLMLKNPAVLQKARSLVDEGAGRGDAAHRTSRPAALPRADPDGEPAPVADRVGLHGQAIAGYAAGRQVPADDERQHHDPLADPASRTPPCGPMSKPSGRSGSIRRAPRSCHRMPGSRSATARAPVSAAPSPCRKRSSCSR